MLITEHIGAWDEQKDLFIIDHPSLRCDFPIRHCASLLCTPQAHRENKRKYFICSCSFLSSPIHTLRIYRRIRLELVKVNRLRHDSAQKGLCVAFGNEAKASVPSVKDSDLKLHMLTAHEITDGAVNSTAQ